MFLYKMECMAVHLTVKQCSIWYSLHFISMRLKFIIVLCYLCGDWSLGKRQCYLVIPRYPMRWLNIGKERQPPYIVTQCDDQLSGKWKLHLPPYEITVHEWHKIWSSPQQEVDSSCNLRLDEVILKWLWERGSGLQYVSYLLFVLTEHSLEQT
jgi:hypothetical protein